MLPQHHGDRRSSNSSKAGTKRALAEQQQQDEAVMYKSYSKDADPLLLAKVGSYGWPCLCVLAHTCHLTPLTA